MGNFICSYLTAEVFPPVNLSLEATGDAADNQCEKQLPWHLSS
jgi:hypothetical protein